MKLAYSFAARNRSAFVITAVAMTLLLSSLGQTIVATALPTIVGDLGGGADLTWVVVAYLVSATVVAPVYGKLGDLFGRKIVLQIAVLVFLAGSALAALAFSMTFLIIARVIQGLGGGGLMVVAMTVVADVIPSRERGRVQGVLGGVFGLSTVAGPLLGGLLVDRLGWHSIFLLNLPIGLAALAVITFALEPTARRQRPRIDYAGFVLLAATLAAFIAVTSLGGRVLAWTSPTLLVLAVAFIACLAGFVRAEQRAAEPVLPLGLFRINTFAVVNGIGLLTGMAMFGCTTFVPLFLQTVKGDSPTVSGLQLIPMMGGLVVSSTLAGLIMSRTGRYKGLAVGATVMLTTGLVILASIGVATPAWQIAGAMLLVGLGLGPVNSVGVTAIQNAVDRATVGVATASSVMFRQIGGSVGVSLLGSVFASGLAARAFDGAGRLDYSAKALSGFSEALRINVLEAFTEALHPVFYVAAAGALVTIALALCLKELPLATALRREPEAELAAELAATSAASGAPVSALEATEDRGVAAPDAASKNHER